MKFSNVTLITANFNNALLTRVMIMSLIQKAMSTQSVAGLV